MQDSRLSRIAMWKKGKQIGLQIFKKTTIKVGKHKEKVGLGKQIRKSRKTRISGQPGYIVKSVTLPETR